MYDMRRAWSNALVWWRYQWWHRALESVSCRAVRIPYAPLLGKLARFPFRPKRKTTL
jgi:hypothetical protein